MLNGCLVGSEIIKERHKSWILVYFCNKRSCPTFTCLIKIHLHGHKTKKNYVVENNVPRLLHLTN